MPTTPSPVEFELAEGTVVGHYANGVKLVFEDGKWPLHVRFVGSGGLIYVDDDGNIEAEPKSLLADRKFGKGYPQANHVRNFLDCVKTRSPSDRPARRAPIAQLDLPGRQYLPSDRAAK